MYPGRNWADGVSKHSSSVRPKLPSAQDADAPTPTKIDTAMHGKYCEALQDKSNGISFMVLPRNFIKYIPVALGLKSEF